jgi:branched-subunit amino acid transport protein
MEMNIWFIMLSLGLLTFLTRLSFIGLHNLWTPPELFRRALHYVPVAVLTAIIVPELLLHTGSLDLSPLNPRLLAGAVAIFVAWRTKNTVLTIVIGMGVFWVVSYLLR